MALQDRWTIIARRSIPVTAALALLSLMSARPVAAGMPEPPAAPVEVSAPEDPADTTAVRFHFGWPAGTRATVETMRVRARTLGDDGDTLDAAFRCRMNVSAAPGGLRIAYDQFEFPDEPTGDRTRQIQGVLQALSSLSPGMVVNRRGEFVHLEGMEELRRALDPVLANFLGPIEDAPPSVRRLVEAALSESTMEASAGQEWNSLVGSWLDAEFRMGHSYSLQSAEPIPLLGGARVPMTYEFALVGRGPCADGDSLPACVMVTLDSWPDPDSMKVAIGDFVARLDAVPRSGAFLFRTLDTSTHLLVVMDAETMLPYRMELTRAVEGSLRTPDGEEMPFQQVDLRRTTYDYRRQTWSASPKSNSLRR